MHLGTKMTCRSVWKVASEECEQPVFRGCKLFETDGVYIRVCFNRKSGVKGAPDILSMTSEDLAAMHLHPATLQYSTRVTTESRFWSKDRSQLSESARNFVLFVIEEIDWFLGVILSFSELPKTPCDFLSMTYDVPTRSATILVRQSWEPRRHNLDDLDEYDHRLESCRAHWAHPLIMPVVLLQVQFMRCEEAVMDNNTNVASLEHDVSNIAGFDTEDPAWRRLQRQLSHSKRAGNKTQAWGPMTMTNLMKKAHEVLKDTIKLLDTIRWMERAIKLLILAGDELAERMGSSPSPFNQDLSMLSPVTAEPDRFGAGGVSPLLSPVRPSRLPHISLSNDNENEYETLETHWHEIRQYLDGLLRLCMGLETDRRMSEARCRAQIDMVSTPRMLLMHSWEAIGANMQQIYSKMAQEDNVLNARMAVASSRDSSSMKALAVITAIFLPGEFLASLMGMAVFDWLGPEGEGDDGEPSAGNVGGGPQGERGFSNQFWVYWAISIPLTIITLCIWRAWWVTQDRYFRRHLSKELSEERFWTSDGKPRTLDKSFFHDFFYLSARRDEKATHKQEELAELETINTGDNSKDGLDGSRGANIRQRRMLAMRRWTLKQKVAIGSV